MRHVAAYLLAALGGNENPSASDIKAILSSVGVEADDKSLKTVVDSLKGKVRDNTLSEISMNVSLIPSFSKMMRKSQYTPLFCRLSSW